MMTAVCPRCEYVGPVSMDGEWVDHTPEDCDARLAARGVASGAFTVKCNCFYHAADGRCMRCGLVEPTAPAPTSEVKARAAKR